MPDDRIQFLIDNLQEGLDVEVKNWLGGLQTNEQKAILAKEIIALANGGGGFIFIGFEDEGEGHPEIEPEEGQLAAFNQDALAGVVERYVTPPLQCWLGFYCRTGSDVRHPVISVPGQHRTPVWAKRASPDERSLKSGAVYIRRPGGVSEPARTQDDWEKLLERLVRARQGDQLNAIREILNPPQVVSEPVPDLEAWDTASYEIWQALVGQLPEGDGRRLEGGHWTFSFDVQLFDQPTLAQLNQFLVRETPRYSGWRPFTYLYREPGRPEPHGSEIRAWLAHSHNSAEPVSYDDSADFWRITTDGKGFSLRPMQEDDPAYLSNRVPRPQGKFFDWSLPIYRMAEFLKFVEALGLRFGDESARYSVLLRYHGTAGRQLQTTNIRLAVDRGATTAVDVIESRRSGQLAEISLNLDETIFALLSPVYAQFQFEELPLDLVNYEVRKALAYPNG